MGLEMAHGGVLGALGHRKLYGQHGAHMVLQEFLTDESQVNASVDRLEVRKPKTECSSYGKISSAGA